MANFSRNTFAKIKHYVGVRLQQGVPLVDADWNEQEDIRKHELQTFLERFVGDGVPLGNDGFRVIPVEDPKNNFTIKGGTGERPGYCLVQGRDAQIEADIDYTEQPLYDNDALAQEWGIEPLKPLSPPEKGDRVDTVFLDLWEREVDAREDIELVNPAIGIETCVRLKREWVVRVAPGAGQPPPPPSGHAYYPLAQITRKAGEDAITAPNIRDLRQTDLTLQPNTRGTVSSPSNIENVTTPHLRQINASGSSTSSNYFTQVNASCRSTASGHSSQVNASHDSAASKTCCQVNASYKATADGGYSQVNASLESQATGQYSQVNASTDSTAHSKYTQVNSSNTSAASGYYSQVNASANSTTSQSYSQVNASNESKAVHLYSQVNASQRVQTKSNYTVCGGHAGSGTSDPGNRKWELNSLNGNISTAGGLTSLTSDYGEYFENLKQGEIDIGVLVALEGARVRPAEKDEDFIGVVSGTAAIRLGDSPFCWQGRYQKDEWGRPVYREIKDPDWEPKRVPDEEWKPQPGETEADRPMIEIETEADRPMIRVQKENPDYDPQKDQVPRSERPEEWTLVGLLGQVYVRCDATVAPGDFVKCGNKGLGTKSEKKTRLRAMKVTRTFDRRYAVVCCLLI